MPRDLQVGDISQPVECIGFVGFNAGEPLGDVLAVFDVVSAHDGDLLHPGGTSSVHACILHDTRRLRAG